MADLINLHYAPEEQSLQRVLKLPHHDHPLKYKLLGTLFSTAAEATNISQDDYDFDDVHVQFHPPTFFRNHTGNTGTVCRHKRAADLDGARLAASALQAGCRYWQDLADWQS